MKAVILAGGKGLRLREVIKDIPKPMAPVNDRPFLEYLVLQLVRWDIKELIFSIGYKGEVIRSFFNNGEKWGVTIEYSEETEPLGTAGALREAAKLIADEKFIAMNGDSFFNLDLKALIGFHEEHNARATIGLVQAEDSGRYGSVKTNGGGEIVDFTEKGNGDGGAVNGGIYILHRSFADFIPPGKVSLETDVLPKLAGRGLYGMAAKGFFIDIGIPGDYFQLCKNHQRLFEPIELG
ncbi:MAG: nucleotidyltransferase family protein [Nitrospirae bacterium]|nr:nucleotidyltransferase family protein [Nitrospirota bacterium]